MTLGEVCEKQNEAIKILSDTVDGLFMQLSQHLTAEEMDALPEMEKIKEAVRIKGSVEGGLTDGYTSNDRHAPGI